MIARFFRISTLLVAVAVCVIVLTHCSEQAATNEVGAVFTGGIEAIDSVLTANTGRYLLMNVWATWCRPCVAETPDLVAFAHNTLDRPLTMFGLSTDYFTDDDTTAVRKVSNFQAKYQIPYSNLVFTGSVDDLTERLDLDGPLPTTILFDPAGDPIRHFIGKLDSEQLEWIAEQNKAAPATY
jgi:thiol-disulfide isomerase/thioredoxin